MLNSLPLTSRCEVVSKASAAVGLLIAAMALAGWFLGIPALRSIHPNLAGMSAITALCLVACGVGLLLLQRGRPTWANRAGLALGAAVLAFALLKLLDGWLFPEVLGVLPGPWGPGEVYPAAMSDYTVSGLVLLGAAVMLLSWKTPSGYAPAQFLALGSMAIGMFVLIGYVYDVQSIIHGTPNFPMALPAAVAIVALNVSVLCARPTQGPMVVLSRNTPGGHLMRSLLPTFLVLPFLLGWLRLQGERIGLYEAWFGVALMTVVMIACFLGVTWRNAYLLDRKEHERETAQAALQAAYDRLQRSDRHKDEFLAIVSHELRTPLNFVIGFVSFLQEGVGGRLPPEQQGYANRAMGGAERLRDLVTDLVDYARILSGKLTLDPVPTPYGMLLDEALERIRPMAEAKAIAVVADTAAPGLLVIDGYWVALALNKLLDNAVKFSPEGGRIGLRTTQGPEWLRTEVTDSGPGVPLDEQWNIFRHFQQADMSSTRASGGLGLGLAISKAIIEAHGGRIGVESEPGAGSTFWFELPLPTADAA
ncbi:Signal transduction histidine-protein kinase BarA [compost metagenome]